MCWPGRLELVLSPWFPAAISALLLLVGMAVQVAGIAYFLGRMKQSQEGSSQLFAAFQGFMQQTLDALTKRLASHDESAGEMALRWAALDARVGVVESNTRELPGMRDEVVRISTKFAGHAETYTRDQEKHQRDMASIQRQLGSLVAEGRGAPSVTRLPVTDEGR